MIQLRVYVTMTIIPEGSVIFFIEGLIRQTPNTAGQRGSATVIAPRYCFLE